MRRGIMIENDEKVGRFIDDIKRAIEKRPISDGIIEALIHEISIIRDEEPHEGVSGELYKIVFNNVTPDAIFDKIIIEEIEKGRLQMLADQVREGNWNTP